MDKSLGLIFLLICVGLVGHMTHAAFMEKLANSKICADKDCSYVISMAQALEDYVASDCRYINLRRGQMIYVFSKLKPAEGAGVFWSGSVYGERYVDQMGVIGYFPSNYVNETHVFQKKTVEIPTTVSSYLLLFTS
uniref:Otoraplin n=1 Tax=Cyprinus carpio carpio TaxID=630221 RepID=A0A8C1A0R2_CYPCA